MRVIHIAGTSGSGKTTFIRSLIPLLQEKGATAMVKHLGHHQYALEAGKDTTLVFGEGVAASAGVDPEKTVMVLRDTSLDHVLSILSSTGVRYMLLEGWKWRPFPKIVIGELSGAKEVVLSNPTADEVLASLEMFPVHYSLEGLIGEIEGEHEQAVILAGRYPVTQPGAVLETRREFYLRFSPILTEIARDAAFRPGDVKVGLHLHQGLLFGGEDAILVAVGAGSPEAAMIAFSSLQGRILSALESGKFS